MARLNDLRKKSFKSLTGLIFFFLLVFFDIAFADELIIISPHWEGYKREFEWGFLDWYREKFDRVVDVRWVDIGGTSDALRYILSQREHSHIDIFFGGGIEPFLELKRQKMLLNADLSPEIKNAIPEYVGGNRIYDEEGYWYSVNLAGFGIIYNKSLFRKLRLPPPASWQDLIRPELKGWVSTADPRKSGSMRLVYESILQFYGWEQGWDLLFKIAHNARSFSAHSSQTPKDIALGEIAAGIVIDSYARDLVRNAGEELVGFTIPDEFKPIVGDGIGILAGAPNQEVAKSFLHYALSLEAQSLLMKRKGTQSGPRQYELGRMSVLPSLYQESDHDLISTPNPFTVKSDFRFDFQKASRRWAVLTDLIGVSIIDPVSMIKAQPLTKYAPPISEVEVESLVDSKTWDNLEDRDHTLNEIYRKLEKKFSTSKNPVLQNLPIILFLCGMLGILFITLKVRGGVVKN